MCGYLLFSFTGTDRFSVKGLTMFFTTILTVFTLVVTTSSQNLDIHYDVTTLVKSDKGQEKTIVVARGNARGLPLRRGRSFLNATYAGHRCCQDWTREGWNKLDIQAALSSFPPLDPGTTASSDGTTYEADKHDRLATIFLGTREIYWEWDSNTNTAVLPVDGRLRLSFRSSNSTSTLQLYLCDTEAASYVECVAFFLSGYDSTRASLRYEALQLSNSGTGPPIVTPFGRLKRTVLHKNESAPQTWTVNATYNFIIERTSEGTFEVRLDGADFQQKRLLTVKATSNMTDPTWYGYLRPGGQMWIEFKPPENELDPHLGVFLCADRFQEECVGEVINGVTADGIRYVIGNYSKTQIGDTKYWVAGTEEETYHRTVIDQSENVQASWDKNLKKRAKNIHIFSVSRFLNGSMQVQHIDLSDSKSQIVEVPKEYLHIFIASHRNNGHVLVFPSNELHCTGPEVCISPAPVWMLRAAKGELRSPTLPASIASFRLCVTIVARVSPGSRVSVTMQRTGDSRGFEMGKLSIGSQDPSQWLTERFVKVIPKTLRGKPLEIVVSVTQPARNPEPVMIQWVNLCNADGNQDVYEENVSEEHDATELGYNVLIKHLKTQSHPVCMNSGHLNLVTNKCQCAPGFSGAVCDRGCGPNSFGADCSGKCSLVFSGSECSGLKLCAPGLPCDCAPGFGGPTCTEKCQPGSYGIGCQESCGQCRDGLVCDPYTGRCQDGCQGALQPPYCKEGCGRSPAAESYIIGGEDANAKDFPWHAGVYEVKRDRKDHPAAPESFEQICGATLVKPQILISAAHCFYSDLEGKLQPARKYKVALGKTYRGWDDPLENPPERVQRRDVYWIHVLNSYRGDFVGFADDIAVIELFEPILFTSYVSPICLDWTGSFDSVLDFTRSGTVVGWGKTINGTSSRQLKVATLSYIGPVECLDRITDDTAFGKYINKDKFCAGDFNGNAVSRGDSGGGILFKNHDHDGAWFLRGVVSVGPTKNSNFAVYTNVSSYRWWLTALRDVIDIRGTYLVTALYNIQE